MKNLKVKEFDFRSHRLIGLALFLIAGLSLIYYLTGLPLYSSPSWLWYTENLLYCPLPILLAVFVFFDFEGKLPLFSIAMFLGAVYYVFYMAALHGVSIPGILYLLCYAALGVFSLPAFENKPLRNNGLFIMVLVFSFVGSICPRIPQLALYKDGYERYEYLSDLLNAPQVYGCVYLLLVLHYLRTRTPETAAAVETPEVGDISAMLRSLETAYREGVFTEEEYTRKRSAILDRL